MCDRLCIDVYSIEHRRSFDYYNRSRCLATAFSFRKWFPPDGSRQSERISTWFPRTVRARTFAFSCYRCAFAVTRSLKRNAKRKFHKKNEYVDKSKFTGSEKPLALFLSPLFTGVGERTALRAEEGARDFKSMYSYIDRYLFCVSAKLLISLECRKDSRELDRNVKLIFVASSVNESIWQLRS